MGLLLSKERFGSVSPLPDGERVGVVGQDRPLSPDLPALVAFQAGSVQPVAAFEVTDPALLAGSVAPQPALGALGGRFLAASDEHRLGLKVLERGVRRAGVEPAVQRRPRCILIPSRSSSATVPRQQRVLGRVAQLGRRPAGSTRARRVLVCSVTSANWLTNPNSFGFPSLPLRIGRASGSCSDTIRSLIGSPCDPLTDLRGDLLAAIRHLLQRGGRLQLRLRAPPTRPAACAICASRRASLIERSNSSPVSPVNFSTSALASPERRRIVRVIALSL